MSPSTCSSPDFNETHAQSILAMITSAGGEWTSDVALLDWSEAGLSVPCKVRLKLFTLDDALILRKAGALSERDAESVKDSLARFVAVAVEADAIVVTGADGACETREPLRL